MVKLNFFSLLVGVLLFSSCKNSSQISSILPYQIEMEKSIYNVKSIPLSTIGKELQYIPLETNPDCTIRRIDQIAFSDSLIFVSDGNKLLQFGRNGRFIRQIGSQGRGPEEYQYIFDFCIDNKKEIIYIGFSSTRKALSFDFKGPFISSFGFSFQSTQFIMKDHNSLMFHLPNISMPSIDTAYSWYITNTDGATLSKIRNYLKRESNSKFMVPTTPLYLFNETAHFMEFGIDTLYYYNDSIKEPYAIFNLGNLKMNFDPDPKDKLNQKFYIYTIIEDTKNLYLNLQSSLGNIVPSRFNKQTSEVAFPENEGFLNDIDGGPVFWPKVIYNDSILVDFIDASKLLDFINKKLSNESGKTDRNNIDKFATLKKQLTETSNPVLMIVK